MRLNSQRRVPIVMRHHHHHPAPLVEQEEAWTNAWNLVLGAGWVLFVVGLADVALAWYPAHTANPTWEFNGLEASVTRLPLVATGLVLSAAGGLLTERRRTVQIVAGVGLCLGLITLLSYVLYLADTPLVLRMATAQAAPAIRKSIARVSLMALAFAGLFFVIGVSVIRYLRRNPI